MGCDIQINPSAPARGVSPELFDLLRAHATDFEIQYCYVLDDRAQSLVAALGQLVPRDDHEALVVRELTERLAEDGGVELMMSR